MGGKTVFFPSQTGLFKRLFFFLSERKINIKEEKKNEATINRVHNARTDISIRIEVLLCPEAVKKGGSGAVT